MQYSATNIEDYFKQIPEERQKPMRTLWETVCANIPTGFEACMNYNMPSFVVPHKLFPAGYHCDPKLPLPFLSIASQKNFIAFYHMGIYANESLNNWFRIEYQNLNIGKLDAGKSCLRFKNSNKIPFDLLGELLQKISVDDWINLYSKR